MDINQIEYWLYVLNFVVGSASLIFMAYSFFKLTISDNEEKTLHLNQLFDKFKRYDILKVILIYLVIAHYFIFLGRIAMHTGIASVFYEVFIFMSNILLVLVNFKLFKLLKLYVPEVKEKKAGEASPGK